MDYRGNHLLSANDFESAYEKAIIVRVFETLRYGSSRLVPFEEIREILGFVPEKRLGLQQVEIKKIVGSDGRYAQFTRGFLPKSRALKWRWMSVDLAHLEMNPLPPVELYEVGGIYFVRDGNHRVSVAKTRGIEHIEARVISLPIGGELRENMDAVQMQAAIQQIQRRSFFEKTGLDEIAPDEKFELTYFLGYDRLYRNIREFGIRIGGDRNVPRPEEAEAFRGLAGEWYRQAYKPTVRWIMDTGISDAFPGRTPGDVFLLLFNFINAADDEKKARRIFVQCARELITRGNNRRTGLKRIVSSFRKAIGRFIS